MRNRVPHWIAVSIALQLAMACTIEAGIITDVIESGTGQNGDYDIVDSVADGGPGLQEGSRAYMDRSYFWTGPGTDPIASDLLGLEYVKTRNNDKNVADLAVDITFGNFAYVYLFDYNTVNVSVSGATFTTIGTGEIALDENGANRTFWLRMAVVAPGDTITVGRDSGLMWGLAVAPVPEPSAMALALLAAPGLAAMGWRRRGRRRANWSFSKKVVGNGRLR